MSVSSNEKVEMGRSS